MKSEEGFPQGEKRRKLIKDDAGKILEIQRMQKFSEVKVIIFLVIN